MCNVYQGVRYITYNCSVNTSTTAGPKGGGTGGKQTRKAPTSTSFLNPFQTSKANDNKETASSDDVCTGDLIPGEEILI